MSIILKTGITLKIPQQTLTALFTFLSSIPITDTRFLAFLLLTRTSCPYMETESLINLTIIISSTSSFSIFTKTMCSYKKYISSSNILKTLTMTTSPFSTSLLMDRKILIGFPFSSLLCKSRYSRTKLTSTPASASLTRLTNHMWTWITSTSFFTSIVPFNHIGEWIPTFFINNVDMVPIIMDESTSCIRIISTSSLLRNIVVGATSDIPSRRRRTTF